MDAAVVRDVFKLRVSWWSLHPFEEIKGRPYRLATYGIECLLADDKGDVPTLEMLTDKDWEPVPLLSTDIAAADVVIDKMEELGFSFNLRSVVPSSDPPVYIAYFAGDRRKRVTEFTRPLAICRAALKAMESRNDN